MSHAANRLIERLMRRLHHVVGIGRTTAPIDDSGAVQTVQIADYAGTVSSGVPVVAIFGLCSSMPAGSDVAYVALRGDASAKFIVGTANQASRPKNRPLGSTTLYDSAGSMVMLNNDGTITLQPQAGILNVIGKIQATGDVIAGFGTTAPISVMTHKHPTAPSGPESEPIP